MHGNSLRTHELPLVLAMLASGCCMLGGSAPVLRDRFDSELSLETVARLAAMTLRTAFPDADPIPYHADPPLLRRNADQYEVHYARSDGDGWRVAHNGRMGQVNAASGT